MEAVKEKLWNRNYLRVWTANFMLFFSFMLLMPLLPLYLNDTFGATPEQIGAVLSGYTITALIVRAFSGYIVDTFTRRTVLLISYAVFALFFSGYLLAGSVLAFTFVRTFHGAPFAVATVANSTVAIDVLPSSRRAEGIGYFGLSNNIATAIGPTVALLIYGASHSYNLLFAFSLLVSFIGFMINASLKLPVKERKTDKPALSFDRFFLLKGWTQSICIVCFSFSYGILSTYVAIYGKDVFGITNGTGLFFALFAAGLILSRLTGSRTLRRGLIIRNASLGIIVSMTGYFIFAMLHNLWGYFGAALVIGLGNGHMYPAFQNMFINLANNDRRGTANSSILVSWDVGLGLGILAGGVAVERFGYFHAFELGWLVNLIGAIFFFLVARRHYLHNKLR